MTSIIRRKTISESEFEKLATERQLKVSETISGYKNVALTFRDRSTNEVVAGFQLIGEKSRFWKAINQIVAK